MSIPPVQIPVDPGPHDVRACAGRAFGCPRRARGFSLTELMVTLAMMAILVGFAMPSLRNVLANGEMAATANALVHSLQLARSEAIKRGMALGLCPSAQPLAVEPVCSAGAGYESGWIIYADQDGDGVLDGGEALIHQQEPLGSGYTFAPADVFEAGVWFDATGASSAPAPTMPRSGSIEIKHRSGEPRRVVRISANGRIATETP